jgi:putative toxin-antitoxin system antitoxin component (TIGR02293 family)
MATSPNLDEYIGVYPQSDFELAEIVEKGLPTDSVARLKEKGLTFSEIAEIVIAPRTLKHRNVRGELLSREETDRIVRVARIVGLAEQIFGDREKSFGWLRLPDERLHGRTPLSMLRTESGGRLIEDLLWQIDEGVFA